MHNFSKSCWLQKQLLEMSYDLEIEGTDADAIFLERVIEREKTMRLKKYRRISAISYLADDAVLSENN